ncbi:MAG: CoA-binding protein [Stackebrandtia sp.]
MSTSGSDISALWNARSIAVVGASDKPGSTGGRVLDYLRRGGFAGRVVPVHPSAATVRGLPATVSLTAVEPVELALLLVPAARVPDALDDCLAAGVRTVIIGASGFAETGDAATERELADRAAAAGARLLGPNCIGSANLHTGLVASFSPFFTAGIPAPSGLAMVSHSGGLGFGIAGLAAERGLAPGRIVTTGNEADIGAGEVLCALAESEDCTGLLAYLESIPDPKWLARLHATGKPAAALYAAPHSRGNATGSGMEEAARVLPQYGIALAHDVDELLDLACGFGTPPPAGPRVGVVTTSGGAGHLAVQAIIGSGLILPPPAEATRTALSQLLPDYATIGNPVDVTASAASNESLLTRALSIMLADENLDTVLVCLCVLAGRQAEQVATAIAEAAGNKPILVSRTGSRELAPGFDARLAAAGVGVYPSPGRAVAALSARRQTFQRK